MSSNTNFATWNPLTKGSYTGLFNGNTTARSISNADLGGVTATIGITTGKWYWETYVNFSGTGYVYAGLSSGYEGGGSYSGASATNGMTPGAIRIRDTGALFDSSSSDDPDRWGTITLNSTGTASFTTGDIISFALDYDNKKLWISKNGTFFNSGNPAGGSNQQASWTGDVPIIYPCAEPYHTNNDFTINAGQDSSFAGQKTSGSAAATDGNGYGDFYYTPPTNFLSLNSANAPISDDIDPAETDDDIPQKQFNSILYTGTGSSNAISGLGFQPDLVWLKQRGSGGSNMLLDTNRGTNSRLSSNNTNDERTASSYFTSFDSDGFTVTGNDAISNASSGTFVGWCWKCAGGTTSTNNEGNHTCTLQANAKAGFSIMTLANYTSASGVTIGHGLGKAPSMYIHKSRASSGNWHIYHKSLGATKAMFFTNAAAATAIGYWANTEPTADVLSLGNTFAGTFNGVVYAWAEIEGYSKFGTYEGNQNADGPFIYTGFRPKMVFVKNADTGSTEWSINDTARNTFNPTEKQLNWDNSNAELTGKDIDFLSNGFKIRKYTGGMNDSGTHIYGAWGDVPFKYNNTF